MTDLKALGLDAQPMPAPEPGMMVKVDKKEAVKICLKLKDAGYDFLTMLTAVCRDGGFDIVYLLDNWKTGECVWVYAFAPKDDLEIDSLTPHWKAADWLEREVFDLFGVTFIGHPNLERILTPEGFMDYPLRKEFSATD